MKFAALIGLACLTASGFAFESNRVSVMKQASYEPAAQQEVGSVLEGTPLDSAGVDEVILNGPVFQGTTLDGAHLVPYQTQRVPAPGTLSPAESVILPPPPTDIHPQQIVDSGPCGKCKCCCKRATQEMTFCLVDPRGCEFTACANVPCCCIDEQPIVTWKRGLVGRMIATICWECCDHEIKVIVTRRGKVKVRD